MTPHLDVRASPGKGKGLFTTEGIAIGQLVLQECALINVVIATPLLGPLMSETPAIEQLSSIMHQWATLPPELYTNAMDLHVARQSMKIREKHDSFTKHDFGASPGYFASEHHLQSWARSSMAVHSNAIEFRGHAREKRLGLFLVGSRINHSCQPNILCEVATGGVMSCIATRQIEAGEELLLSFVDLSNTKFRRHRRLNEKWNFLCTCPRCSGALQLPPRVDNITSIGSFSDFNACDFAMSRLNNTDLDELWRWTQLISQHIVEAESGASVDPSLYFLYRDMAFATRQLAGISQSESFLETSNDYWTKALSVAVEYFGEYSVFADV